MSETEDIRDKAVQPEAAGNEAAKEPSDLEKAIMAKATEEDAPVSSSVTLPKILGGDFLTADVIRRQIGVIIIIAFFTMIYVSNRYSCQQDMLEINELKAELKDAKYRALASSSELTEISRESNVLKMLKNNADSVLQIPTQPPYIINVPADE